MGFGELIVIVLVALILIGPREMPAFLLTLGQFFRWAKGILYTLQNTLEQFVETVEIEDYKREMEQKTKSPSSPE